MANEGEAPDPQSPAVLPGVRRGLEAAGVRPEPSWRDVRSLGEEAAYEKEMRDAVAMICAESGIGDLVEACRAFFKQLDAGEPFSTEWLDKADRRLGAINAAMSRLTAPDNGGPTHGT